MEYEKTPTDVLEEEYKKLCFVNPMEVNKDVYETIKNNIEKIASILYSRQYKKGFQYYWHDD